MRLTAATPPRLAMKALRSISMLTSCATAKRLRSSSRRFNGKNRSPTNQRPRPSKPIPWLSRYGRDQEMPNPSPELLHGTLDALVLKTLSGGRRHGYAIARTIEDATGGVVEIEEGSLYPALYRMERKGWIGWA